MDEYKILQDKIDKIGAFRFTIKGWSITVVIAAVVAGSATKSVPPWLWFGVLIVFLIGFFLFEKQQTDLRHRFSLRVLVIEDVMSRLLRAAGRQSGSDPVIRSFTSLHFIPGIGHHVQVRRARKRGSITLWRSCIDADIMFYFVQIIVLLLVVCFGHTSPQDRSEGFAVEKGSQAVELNPQAIGENNHPAATIHSTSRIQKPRA
jgi:hypothetical protein